MSVYPILKYESSNKAGSFGAGFLRKLEKKEQSKRAKSAVSKPKKKHWEPPPFIDFDRMSIDTHPTLSSRFFCVENQWDENRKNQFLAGERKKRDLSELQLRSICAAGQPQRAEDNRLVNTRKCPTHDKTLNKLPAVARFYEREWSGEYRVSIESFTRQGDAPPPQAGERATEALTDRAARNIIDSGAFMAAKKGGYSTFLTLTFDAERREAITKLTCQGGELAFAGECSNGVKADGDFCRIEWKTESTIGKEVSRFMDALQKKYQRGWTWQPTDEEKKGMLDIWEPKRFEPTYVGVKHSKVGAKPIAKKINYVWVAENPDKVEVITNGVGEEVRTITGTNPHVHMLLDWKVEKLFFRGWAQQIEQLWGNGYAKLEKIRSEQKAAGYLMKALGYMTKGAQTVDRNTGEIANSQGRIIGNRYGISSGARAPKWECIAEYDAAIMSRFVANVGQQIQQKQESIKNAIKHIKEKQKDAVNQRARTLNYKNVPAQKRQQLLARLEKQIQSAESTREKLEAARQNNAWANKYKITFRNLKQMNAFIENAVTQQGWKADILEHTKEFARTETRKISDWAKSKGQAIYNKVAEQKAALDCYWQQVLSDPLPPESHDIILV